MVFYFSYCILYVQYALYKYIVKEFQITYELIILKIYLPLSRYTTSNNSLSLILSNFN